MTRFQKEIDRYLRRVYGLKLIDYYNTHHGQHVYELPNGKTVKFMICASPSDWRAKHNLKARLHKQIVGMLGG